MLDINNNEKSLPEPKIWGNTGGHPSGAGFDSNDTMYIADFAHSGVLAVNSDGEAVVIAKEYEGKSFLGPNSIVFSRDGRIFFSDSGPKGTSTLDNPCGSLYCISGSVGRPILRPLSTEKLAHPSGVALSQDGNIVFVCETMRNRILRYAQKPTGVYHASIFHQFSGGLGPTAIAISSSGNIYVSRYDFPGCSIDGKIHVLSPDGQIIGEISIPQPEITGLALNADETSLIVTEGDITL